ncbi:MAG: hypothetical protein R3B82_14525 [Sandaracinaceae bacterium]
MIWWGLGAAVLVVVVIFVGWLVMRLRHLSKRGVLAFELAGATADALDERIARILDVNARLDAAATQDMGAVRMFPSPTWRPGAGGRVEQSMTVLPAMFHEMYYGAEGAAALDEDATRDLLVEVARALGESPPLGFAPLGDIIDLYEGDVDEAPQMENETEYVAGDRTLSLLIADTARCLFAGATLDELRTRWALSDDARAAASLEGKLADLLDAEAQAFVGSLNVDGALLEDPGPSPREDIRPRFLTPGRRARADALIAQVAAKHGLALDAVERPAERSLAIPGLPYPLDFIVDAGMHVMSWVPHPDDADGELGLSTLRVLGTENLKVFGPAIELPDEAPVDLVDEGDHGAARILLVPEALGDGETVLAVAPSHGVLILFADGDPEQASEARDRFERYLAADDLDDPPIPEPVRVRASGFEATTWDAVLR